MPTGGADGVSFTAQYGFAVPPDTLHFWLFTDPGAVNELALMVELCANPSGVSKSMPGLPTPQGAGRCSGAKDRLGRMIYQPKALGMYNHIQEFPVAVNESVFRSEWSMASGSTQPEDKGLIRKSQTKKPYAKPAFRFERVFETQALSCGKITSQGSCHQNRKTS